MSLLRRIERRAYAGPFGDLTGRIPSPSEAAMSTAGKAVTESTALAQSDVYACATLIADSVALLPAHAYRATGPSRVQVPSQPTMLTEPFPGMDWSEWASRMAISAVLRGNGVAVIEEFDGLGRPSAAWPIHPDDYRIRRNRSTGRVEYQIVNGPTLGQQDVIHVKGMTMPGAFGGIGIVEHHRRTIGHAIATEDFGAQWFADGAAPASVLETDAPMDETKARRQVARFVASHGGRRRPALLSDGLKWRAVSITPNESQFLETMRYNTERIARMFRVPPHMIGAVDRSTSWGSGIEEQGIGYVVFTLGRWIGRFEGPLTRWLPRPQYVKLNPSALLRGNTKDRFASYAVARQWGWLSVNDIRALEDLPPIEGGDVYLQPLNMVDAQDALKVLFGNGGTAQ